MVLVMIIVPKWGRHTCLVFSVGWSSISVHLLCFRLLSRGSGIDCTRRYMHDIVHLGQRNGWFIALPSSFGWLEENDSSFPKATCDNVWILPWCSMFVFAPNHWRSMWKEKSKMHEWPLYMFASFSLAIINWKVQIVATKVAWCGHYLSSHTYLDDIASNCFC